MGRTIKGTMMKKNNKIGMWMILGAGMGPLIGTVIHNMAMGIVFGPAFGLIMGIIFSGENTKDDDIKKG